MSEELECYEYHTLGGEPEQGCSIDFVYDMFMNDKNITKTQKETAEDIRGGKGSGADESFSVFNLYKFIRDCGYPIQMKAHVINLDMLQDGTAILKQ